MIYAYLYSHLGLLGLPAATVTAGLLFYLVFTNASFYFFFVRNRRTFVPDYEPDRIRDRRALVLSVLNITGNTLLLLPVQIAIVFGQTKVYFDLGQHGLLFSLATLAAALVFSETCIYWLHRMLHLRPFYGWLHAPHHEFREPDPKVAFAFHPLDAFLQSLPYHLFIFIVPMYWWFYFPLYVYASFWTLMIHDRVRVVPNALGFAVNHTGCHTAHHYFYRFNYGSYFTLWDRLCGTYFDPDRLPEKFFAVKSAGLLRKGAVPQHPAGGAIPVSEQL